MRARTAPNAAKLGLFWFGIQMVWGALLGISLQARASALATGSALAAYGELAVAGAAAAAVAQICAGIVSDRRRESGSTRIEFYLAGALCAAAAIAWFYTARTFNELLLALIVLQVAMNVAIGPYQAAIPDAFKPVEVSAASSWLAALQSAGNAVGAVLAGLIADTRVVAAALCAALLSTCGATVLHVRAVDLLPPKRGRWNLDRAFLDLSVSRALMYLGFYTLLGYLYFYVRSVTHADAKTTTGLLLLLFTLAGAAGAALCSVARAWDRRTVATVGAAGFIISLIAFLSTGGFAGLLAAAAAAGISWGVFLSADWALGCRFLPRSALATAMGVWNLALILPQMMAPGIATAAIAALHRLSSPGAPRIAFVLACAEVLGGALWIWRLPAAPVSVETVQPGNTP